MSIMVRERNLTAYGMELPEGISQVNEENGVATVGYEGSRAAEVEQELITLACHSGLIPFRIDTPSGEDTDPISRMVLVPSTVFDIDFAPTGELEDFEGLPKGRNRIVAFPTTNGDGVYTDLELRRATLVRSKYGEVGFVRDGEDPYLDRSESAGNQMPMLVVQNKPGDIRIKASQRLVFPYATEDEEMIITDTIIPSSNGGHPELIGKAKEGFYCAGQLPWRSYLDAELSPQSQAVLDESYELMEVTQAANENGRDNRTLLHLIGLLTPLVGFLSTPEGQRILNESERVPSIALAARTGIMGELAKLIPTISEYSTDSEEVAAAKMAMLSRFLRIDVDELPFTIQFAIIGSPAYDLYGEYEDAIESAARAALATKDGLDCDGADSEEEEVLVYGEHQQVRGRVFPCLIRFIPKPQAVA